jgi:hypothetical protein
MSTDLEPYYQEIGRLALEVASEEAGKIMVYAEREDGLIAADVFYAEDDPDVIHYRLCPPLLEAVIDAYWEAAREVDPKGEWAVLSYVLDDGAFKVTLRYPEEIDEDEDVAERRPAAIAAVFGPGVVDYSSPGF